MRSHFILLNIDIIYYKWYNLISNVARGVFMSTANDEFQLMLKQIDMETQIVEYQDFISGNYSLKNAGETLLDVIGNTNAIINFIKSTTPQQVYDVSIKDKVSSLFKDGKVRLGELKDGSGFMPNFVANENLTIDGKVYKENQIVAQARLNLKDITPDMANAINDCIVNMQLARINTKLDEMNKSIGNIEQGQRNDRIALVYSAEEKMKEALATKDNNLKVNIIAEAVSTANDARFQLMETLKTDIKNVIVGTKATNLVDAIEKLIKGNAEVTASIIDKIRTAFFYINMSTSICAQGYMLLGEKGAMQKSINVYKDFINDMFIKNDVMSHLQLYDKNTDNMWLDKPKEIYETLDKFSIRCCDNLKLEEDKHNNIIRCVDLKLEEDKHNNIIRKKRTKTKRTVLVNCGNKSYFKEVYDYDE